MKKLLIAFSFCLTSCVGVGEIRPFTPIKITEPDSGLIYFFNYCTEDGVIGTGSNIYIDGARKAYMAQGTYYGQQLKSGAHEIKNAGLDTPTLKLKFTLRAGETKYFSINSPILISGTPNFDAKYKYEISEVNSDYALRRLPLCKVAKKSYLSTTDAI